MAKRFVIKRVTQNAALSTRGQRGVAAHPPHKPSHGASVERSTVLVGAHYLPDVRRVLKIIEAETGRNLKQVLGEAINDLAAKYDKPHPYRGEQ